MAFGFLLRLDLDGARWTTASQKSEIVTKLRATRSAFQTRCAEAGGEPLPTTRASSGVSYQGFVSITIIIMVVVVVIAMIVVAMLMVSEARRHRIRRQRVVKLRRSRHAGGYTRLQQPRRDALGIIANQEPVPHQIVDGVDHLFAVLRVRVITLLNRWTRIARRLARHLRCRERNVLARTFATVVYI